MSGIGRFTPPRGPQRPRPPKLIQKATKVGYRSGPGEPPAGFVTGTTSLSEWYIYWALLKVKGRAGVNSWGFQVGIGGGRSTAGGAVADFVIWDQKPRLILRIQTERYHVATRNRNQVYDERSKRMMESLGYKVIDIWEQNFIKDKSGKAAIQKVRMALKGLQDPNPITAPQSWARPGRV